MIEKLGSNHSNDPSFPAKLFFVYPSAVIERQYCLTYMQRSVATRSTHHLLINQTF